MKIRPARPGDEAGIAVVHVRSWQTTYRGIMPDDLLDSLSVEKRRQMWEKVLQDAETRQILYVAEEADGQIVGFACGGPEHSGDPLYRGEVYAIYILQSHQGRGIGRQLFRAVARDLKARGLDSLLVWVATENRFRRFYEALGGRPVRTRTDTIGGAEIEETAYGWRSLDPILAE